MFVKNYALRYSDIACDGSLKTTSVLDLLQDISISHADSVGLDAKALRARYVACLLASWRVQFVEKLDVNMPIEVETGLMEVGKCEAFRKYIMRQSGAVKSIATAVWFTVNTETMRVARVADELFTAFDCVDEADNGLPSVRLKPEKDLELLKETVVAVHDLDANRHMNNVKSVEYALDCLPEDIETGELQVKYRKELKAGDVIRIRGKRTDKGFVAEVQNGQGESCVLVHILAK